MYLQKLASLSVILQHIVAFRTSTARVWLVLYKIVPKIKNYGTVWAPMMMEVRISYVYVHFKDFNQPPVVAQSWLISIH